jgi:hypothetical protein
MPATSTFTADLGSGFRHPLSIKIPDRVTSMPRRARRSGGTRRTHPLYTPLTTEAPAITKACSWQLTGLRSNPDSTEVTFHSKRATFAFLSRKSGRTQTGESHYEFANAMEKEVDPNIVDFQLQGIRMRWTADGEERTYTPDAVTLDASGLITVEEVKASPSYFVDPEYRILMNAAASDLGRLGIRFRKVSGEEMERARRRQANVARAFMDRSTAFGSRHVDAVENLFAVDRRQPLGRIEEALGVDLRIANMMVNAMLCARHLSYDLDRQLCADTVVTPAPRCIATLPNIRALKR